MRKGGWYNLHRNSLELRPTNWMNKNVRLASSRMSTGNRLEVQTEPTAKVFSEWMEMSKGSQDDKVRRWAQGCVGKAWPVNAWARVCEVGLNSNDLEVMMDGGRWSEKKGHPPGSGPKEHKLEEKDDQDLPGSWVIKSPCFLCWGCRSDPWSRN